MKTGLNEQKAGRNGKKEDKLLSSSFYTGL